MLYHFVQSLDQRFHFDTADAHCDVPCGIYDPHQAQIAALTVIRMLDIIDDLAKTHKETDLEYFNTLTRAIAIKEEHAELAKREIRVIFGDYIKKEHIDKFPELPELMHKIMQAGSKARQTTSRANGMELLTLINRFAEIFWETKGIATKKVKAPYKPGEEIVFPVL